MPDSLLQSFSPPCNSPCTHGVRLSADVKTKQQLGYFAFSPELASFNLFVLLLHTQAAWIGFGSIGIKGILEHTEFISQT